MRVEVDIPRPLLLLSLVAAFGGGVLWANGHAAGTPAVDAQSQVAQVAPETHAHEAESLGGDDTSLAKKIQEGEEEARRERMRQEVIERRADILRGELKVLEAERMALGDTIDPELEEEFRQGKQVLQALLQDQRRSEQFLLTALNQIWEAQGRATALGEGVVEGTLAGLDWPVAPTLGISAHFHDPAYQKRFGFRHDAIDIPTLQLTPVLAAADGIVKDVIDHGLGFNYITIKHAGGVSTLYGHITQFSVQSGDRVRAGDEIGLSGGRPGTPGAGLSTGPHLHFGAFRSGVAIDPLMLLPPVPARGE